MILLDRYLLGWGNQWRWELGLAPEVPLELEIGLGVGRADIDLTGLTMSNLRVNMRVDRTTVTLPDDGYRQRDDVYTSPGYASADDRVDLEVSQAIGRVTIRQ